MPFKNERMNSMPVKISVLTPTIRGEEALVRVKQGLEFQTMTDFEWIVDDHDPRDGSNLNNSLNEMIKQSKGELIVFLQDYIKIPSEGLWKFWKAYKTIDDTFFTAPVGKITKEGQRPKWDWRVHRSECNWREWEIDWGAAPKEALIKIGGFDEALDKYWGFDNVNAGLRADMADYKFRCIDHNKAIAMDHDDMMEHPFRRKRNPDFHNERLDAIRQGLKINYL